MERPERGRVEGNQEREARDDGGLCELVCQGLSLKIKGGGAYNGLLA